MPLPKTLSYSHIHLLACPYSAFLRYEAGIKGPTTPWLALGNAVHHALELGHEDEEFSLDKSVKLFTTEFLRILNDEEVFISWPQQRKLEAEGIEMLGGYYVQLQNGKIPQRPLLVEEKFRIPFEGTEIVGRIDRIDQLEDGQIIVSDYKTGKEKPDPWFLRHDYQLTTYAWAYLTNHQKLPDKLVWWHMRTGERLESVRTMQDIEDLEQMLRNAIRMKEQGMRHRIFHTQVCKQCEYSGMPRNAGIREENPICDDHELEIQTLARLGYK